MTLTRAQEWSLKRQGYEIPIHPSADPIERTVKAIAALPPAVLGLAATSLASVTQRKRQGA